MHIHRLSLPLIPLPGRRCGSPGGRKCCRSWVAKGRVLLTEGQYKGADKDYYKGYYKGFVSGPS